MSNTKLSPERGKTVAAGKFPKVAVGEAFTADDVQLTDDPRWKDPRGKGKVTVVLLGALITFYAVYIAHEWWAGKPLDAVGRFLENGLAMILAWCVGRHGSR